jgi:hypothetical protein
MIPFSEMDNKELMYAFVGDDGSNIHVAIQRLLKWVERRKPHLKVWQIPVHPHLAKRFINHNLINRERVKELLLQKQVDPIIFGKEIRGRPEDVDMYLLDGRHRYVRAVALNYLLIEAYLLNPNQWRAFQITGVPTITQRQLDGMPVRSKPQ